jgi:uncharacterized protein (TIGR00255 family)
MLRSMTAYGRVCITTPFGRLTVEIQSLNRRHLEIHTTLPREWLGFDSDIKASVAQEIHRGHVTVTVSAAFERESPLAVTPNLALVQQLKEAWGKIAGALQIPLEPSLCLGLLAKEPGVLLYEVNLKDEAECRNALLQALTLCLKQLIAMKQQEGERLLADILPRLDKMRSAMGEIAEKAPQAVKRFRQRLKERLEEVLSGCVENEEKILREVSIYAEKVDIAEEITRFESHLMQGEQLLHADTISVGKTLEFLLQELNREINTIASKASDVEVGRLVIAIKAELERVREQIQNVE